MKKKMIGLLLSAFLLSGCLAGCNAGAPMTKENEAEVLEKASEVTAGDSEGVTIQFWNAFTGTDGDILRDIVAKFNSENEDHITIEMDIMPRATLNEKLAPALLTDTAPALVLQSNTDVAIHAQNGNMIPLDDFFEKTGTDKADFMPAALEGLQYNGSQIMIPMQWCTQYLFYNKDLFKEAGLDPETPPSTWEEIAEYASAITDPSKNIFGYGVCVSGGTSWFNSLFLSNGGNILDLENRKADLISEENIESLRLIQEIVNKKDAPKGTTGADLDNLMLAGQLGMLINGPWMVNGLKENEINFGVAPMPAGKKGQVGITELEGFCIPKGTADKEKEAAYKFIAYWNTSAICKEWTMRNGFPPYLYSVAEDEDVKNDELVNVFSKIADYGQSFGNGLTCTSAINTDALFPCIEGVVAGGDPAAELKKASDKIDELLANE